MAAMDLVVNLGLNATQFTRGLAAASTSLNRISSSGLKRGGGPTSIITGGLGKTIVMANLASKAIWKLGAALAGAAADAVKLHAQTEQTLLSFEVLAGGRGIGTALFNELEQLAQNTALTFDEVSRSAKQLLISFDPTQVPGLIKMLGNISSSIDNVSLQEMAFLLQTSREEGKLLARDLRQFTTRGIPVPRALKEVLGLEGPGAGQKLNDMITAGEVGIQHLFEALQKLGSGNILERMGDTLIGKWMQMVDAQKLMMRDLGTIIAETFKFGTILDWVKARAVAVRKAFKDYRPVFESVFEAVQQGFIMVTEVFGDIHKGMTSLFAEWIPNNTTIIEQITTFSVVAKFAMKEWRLGAQIATVAIALGLDTVTERLKHFANAEAPVYWKFLTDNGKEAFRFIGETAGFFFDRVWKNAEMGFGNMVNNILNNKTLRGILDFIGGHGLKAGQNKKLLGFDKVRFQAMQPNFDTLGDIAKQAGPTDRMKEYQALLKSLTSQFGQGMDAAILAALEKLREFAPAVADELGAEKAFDFGTPPGGSGKGKGKGKAKQLGVMQQGSAAAIQAVLTAMGGRDKSPELVELKRQTMMLKFFGDQLKRQEHYKALHNPQAPSSDLKGFIGGGLIQEAI